MYDILTLNKISQIGLKELDGKYAISDCCENPDGIIVRSAAMHDFAFSPRTVAVARAGAGVNNIPVDECTKKGIVVFNTPIISNVIIGISNSTALPTKSILLLQFLIL